jgi:hypothetical protein
VLTLSQGIDDQDEIDEGEEDYIELFESGEDASEAFWIWAEPLESYPDQVPTAAFRYPRRLCPSA